MLQEQYGAVSENEIMALKQRYGLDLPMYQQYIKWITGIIFRGDFGQSFTYNRSVGEILLERIPLTMLITFITLILTWLIAVPIGVYGFDHRVFNQGRGNGNNGSHRRMLFEGLSHRIINSNTVYRLA